jgi:hypothetical protein
MTQPARPVAQVDVAWVRKKDVKGPLYVFSHFVCIGQAGR